jgi:hypothetical protein
MNKGKQKVVSRVGLNPCLLTTCEKVLAPYDASIPPLIRMGIEDQGSDGFFLRFC